MGGSARASGLIPEMGLSSAEFAWSSFFLQAPKQAPWV